MIAILRYIKHASSFIHIPHHPQIMQISFCDLKMPSGLELSKNRKAIKSIKLLNTPFNTAQLNLHQNCQASNYHATIFSFQGCTQLYDWPPTQSIKVVANSLNIFQSMPPIIPKDQLPPLQERLVEEGMTRESIMLTYDHKMPSYQIVYSCESSEYCAFQAQANYYGFLTSGQHPYGTQLRLQTCSEIDDMSAYIPTFTAPRHPYSRRYAPINKAGIALFCSIIFYFVFYFLYNMNCQM